MASNSQHELSQIDLFRMLADRTWMLSRLAMHFRQVGHSVRGAEAAERRAGFDGLQLLWVAEQDYFGVGFLHDLKHALELAGAGVGRMSAHNRPTNSGHPKTTLRREIAMDLTREAKVVVGIILLAVPTVQYGGLAILGMLTHGVAGVGGAEAGLNAQQLALFRAGHAHAGVWLILSLMMQVLLDSAKLPSSSKWLARIAAPVGTLALSGGFFGLAFRTEFRWLLYFGGLAMFCSLILTGVGMLRNSSPVGTARVFH